MPQELKERIEELNNRAAQLVAESQSGHPVQASLNQLVQATALLTKIVNQLADRILALEDQDKVR